MIYVCPRCGQRFAAGPLFTEAGELVALYLADDHGDDRAIQGLGSKRDTLKCPGLCGQELRPEHDA